MAYRKMAEIEVDLYAPPEARFAVFHLQSELRGVGPTVEAALEDLRAKTRNLYRMPAWTKPV